MGLAVRIAGLEGESALVEIELVDAAGNDRVGGGSDQRREGIVSG